MKANKADAAWFSNPGEVNAYMQKVDHPLVDVIEALRKVILDTDAEVGEHIKWNAPRVSFIRAK